MVNYKFGTISGAAYNPSDGKPTNGRWEIRWYSYPTEEAGVSKVVYDLYKTQDGESGDSVATACIMKAYATKGTLQGEDNSNNSNYCIPIHGDVPDTGTETYSFNTTNGLIYRSGVYKYNTASTKKGCKFTRTYQEFPENKIFPSTCIQDLSYYGTPHVVGEFLIDHDSNGEAEVTFEIYNWVYYSTGSYPSSGYLTPATISAAPIDINYEYTSVTAPSRFATGSSTTVPIAPTSTLTFGWYGAEHGVNNNIDYYSVNFYATTSTSAVGTLIGTTTVKHIDGDWGWASISLKDVTALTTANLRGKWITCTVQSVGTNTGYNSKAVSCRNGFLVNRKPNAPTITQNTSKAPAKGGNVSFTGKVGDDSDTSITKNIFTGESMAAATRTLKYKVGSATSYTTATGSTFSVLVGEGSSDITINFYTYDGVEYSTATQRIVERNIEPKIDLTINPSWVDENTRYAFSSTLSASELNDKSGMSYKFGFKYSTSSSDFSSATKVELRALNSSATYTVSDIRGSIINFSTLTNAFYYKFYAQGFDGIDNSDEVESEVFYIPAKPTFLEIHNQLNGTSISELSNYFSNNISLVFDLDEGYDSVAVYEPIIMAASLKPNVPKASQMTVNIENIPQTLDGGQPYTFNVNFYKSGQLRYQTKLIASSLTRVQTLKTGLENDYKTSSGPMKIYTVTDKDNLLLKITLTKNGSLVDLDNLTAFGISNIYNSCYLNVGNNNKRIPLSLSSSIFKYQDSAGIIYYNYPITQALFMAIKEELNRNGLTNLPISFDIKDAFGSYIKISSPSGIYIDCREAAAFYNKSGGCLDNYISISDSNKEKFHTLVNGNCLVQGMYLFYTGSILSYNTNPTGQIWIKRGEDNWAIYGQPFSFSPTLDNESTPGSPMIYSIERREINNITKIMRKDYSVSFKIVVNTDAGIESEYVFINGLIAKEHQSGAISITNISYSNSSDTLNLSYVVNNPGINLTDTTGVTIAAKFIIEHYNGATEELLISNYIPDENKISYDKAPYTTPITKQLTLATNDSAFYGTLQVVIQYSYAINTDLTFTSVQTTTSTKVTIYNEAPTVSYRQNKLGINTNQIDAWNKAVLVISANNGEQTKILLITPETKPTDEVNYIMSIDTYTGEIDGAIINGGSW